MNFFFRSVTVVIITVLLAACGGQQVQSEPTPAPMVTEEVITVGAIIEVDGTELPDGGWIPTEVRFSREGDNIPLGKVIVTQSALKAEMWDDINENGTLQLVEEVYMENFSFIPITFEVDSVLFPGGTIYCFDGTIYWYPSDIIPAFFESTPDVIG